MRIQRPAEAHSNTNSSANTRARRQKVQSIALMDALLVAVGCSLAADGERNFALNMHRVSGAARLCSHGESQATDEQVARA